MSARPCSSRPWTTRFSLQAEVRRVEGIAALRRLPRESQAQQQFLGEVSSESPRQSHLVPRVLPLTSMLPDSDAERRRSRCHSPCTFAYCQNPFDGALRPTMRAAKYSMRPSEPSNPGDQGCLALVGAAGEAEGSAACISTRSEIRRA